MLGIDKNMGFWKRLFFREKPLVSFEEQVNNEIYNCEQSIFMYQKDLHKIRKLAAELIQKNFIVPKKYWYEELSNLEEIFKLPQIKEIDEHTFDEIKEICKSYKQQQDLRVLKIDVCRKNRNELTELIKQENSLRKELQKEINQEDFIAKHKELSQSITENDIDKEIVSTERIKMLNDEVSTLINELLEKKEFNKQLQILYSKYGNSADVVTVEVYLDELKKLIKKTDL